MGGGYLKTPGSAKAPRPLVAMLGAPFRRIRDARLWLNLGFRQLYTAGVFRLGSRTSEFKTGSAGVHDEDDMRSRDKDEG